MSEKIPIFEKTHEHIPTLEEIISVFERVTEGRAYEEIRRKEDSKGLYLWEIKLSEVGADGGVTEYWYKREGTYPKGGNDRIPVVHITTFDSDGMPTGGSSLAKFKDGSWIYTP